LHGGALATCIDTAAWEAIVRVSDDTWVVADMRIDFVKLARNEAHRVRATARKIGRAQAVADVEISAWDDPSRLVALGRVLLAKVG
ncbi:MAG: PaaI family thioesterase, partial [Acidobacteriota bacterium]|nr:PaaI family thioesterase [Acidobacteriota bacterium]